MRTGEPYELEMLEAMVTFLGDGELVLDVGANIGNHALFLAHATSARVIAFEPNVELVEAILESARLGGVEERVEVRHCALGAKSLRGRLDDLDQTNLGGQTVTEDPDGPFEIRRLDDEQLPGKVRAIKIDVEGMELDVLTGAQTIMANDNPLLYVECLDRDEFDEVEAWLLERGYGLADTFNATPTHLFRPVDDAPQGSVRDALRRSVHARYALEDRYRRMSGFLKRSKDREAVTRDEIITLREGLDERTFQFKSAQAAFERVRGEALVYRRQRDELEQRLADAAAEVRAKHQEIARIGKENAKLARHRERKNAQESKHLRRKIRRLQAALKDLENSRSVRMSRALRDAGRSPRGVARLARDSVGIMRSPARGGSQSTRTEVAREPISRAARPAGPQPAARSTSPSPYHILVPKGGPRGFDLEALGRREEIARRAGAALDLRLAGGGPRPRIAAITDDFTRHGLSHECEWLDLLPHSWEEAIVEFEPDILFVESAWRGMTGAWHNTVPHLPQELRDILAYCERKGIPRLFWNKEDPPHFETFVRTAAEFDHVYTTDIDCVPRYRAVLGHDRVHFMPFACQPRVHNPRESRRRRPGLAFAGGYYTRYRARMRDLEQLLEGASDVMPVDIYDRMLGTTHDEYRFPEQYEHLIVGTLAPDDLDVAYKGYRFAMNLNSIKGSQSMFARRAYELLASGTVTVSNYAHGLRVMLGDLIPMGDSREWTSRTLTELSADPEAYDRLRLMGVRKVHQEHTWAARRDFLLASASGRPFRLEEPSVGVLFVVDGAEDVERARTALARQTGVAVDTTFVTDDRAAIARLEAEGLTYISPAHLGARPSAEFCSGAVGLAVMNAKDWHGPTYLLDLVLASLYSGDQVVGRASFAAVEEGTLVKPTNGWAYTGCHGLLARTSLVAREACDEVRAGSLLEDEPETLAGFSQFTIDRFDYCWDGAALEAAQLEELLGSSTTMSTGYRLEDVHRFVETSGGEPAQRERLVLSTQAMLDVRGPRDDVSVEVSGETVAYTSGLPEDKHIYWWLRRRIPVTEIAHDGELKLRLETSGDLDLMMAIRYFDSSGNVVHSTVRPSNRGVALPVPQEAIEVGFALRLRGPGAGKVHEFALDHPVVDPPIMPGTGEYLVLTDNYPSYEDLYRNGFVHSRVREYRDAGLAVDVFRFKEGEPLGYHEFEGVEVTTGSTHALRATLENGHHKHVLVHFLNPAMWAVLREYADDLKVTVWVHGAEVQPWWRRRFNFTNSTELERAKEASELRQAFWRGLVDDLPAKTHFVFVSRYFADEVMDDLNRSIPEDQVHVVHNPVNTSLFGYVPKQRQDRLRILSIRPFASAKYANDLSVAAVLDLSTEPWFDELHFRFIGDGPLFEETMKPIMGLPNVEVTRGFLTQGEIASLHRQYGVFLAPTRMDAQGVSKDEAMSSGLVPVTSGVTAIPEFVSDREGYLAGLDDATGLADAIRDLYHNPDKFTAKSAAAAARVRQQTATSVVLPQELALVARA
ncbi:FkbM family methyltransferase [Nocardioides guangzhouensis]|nr:FkbM family methyltransferase [Nocardioides guangzhouensis]